MEDIGMLRGHEVIRQAKRILEWRKNNPQRCPFLASK
jgi:hypothetical protein